MKTVRKFSALATLFAGVLIACPSARADAILYGVTYLDNQVITVNQGTGAGTLAAPLASATNPFGLATYQNNLYTYDPNAGAVTQINPGTGATVRSVNVGVGPLVGQGGLAINNAGIGFVTSALDPTTFAPANNLYEFNLATGQSSLVGHTSDTLEALAFNSAGTLYALGKLDGDLYTVNTATGGTTLVGNTGVSVGNPTGGLTFGSNGTLYATLNDSLYTVNTTTGAATAVSTGPMGTLGDIGYNSISGLAFLQTSAVPEPSPLYLTVAASVGLVVSASVRRKWSACRAR